MSDGELTIAGQWTLNKAEEARNTLINIEESFTRIKISAECEMDLVGAQLLLSLLRDKKLKLEQEEFSGKDELENSGIFKTIKA